MWAQPACNRSAMWQATSVTDGVVTWCLITSVPTEQSELHCSGYAVWVYWYSGSEFHEAQRWSSIFLSGSQCWPTVKTRRADVSREVYQSALTGCETIVSPHLTSPYHLQQAFYRLTMRFQWTQHASRMNHNIIVKSYTAKTAACIQDLCKFVF